MRYHPMTAKKVARCLVGLTGATFAADLPRWDRAMLLGADLGSIVMDEPLGASRRLKFVTFEGLVLPALQAFRAQNV